jgi:AcrR family transcriptional regulator
MTAATLQDARSNLVRERVLDGVFEVLAAGDDLTFTRVAKAAGVPERTIYRHFPSKEALHAAIWSWANERMGFTGPFPTDEAGYVALVRTAHRGFEQLAPVIRELLASKDGLSVRLTANEQRRQGAIAAVSSEAPGLGPVETRHVAVALQLLTSAAAWQTMHDYWDMDGEEAGETAALAIELLLAGARARTKAAPPADRRKVERVESVERGDGVDATGAST